MRGKHVLMDSLVGHGIEYLFGNPGTTESPIIDSLPDYPQLRYILALHEAVALGAASFYAQASGRPAVVNLHVAPGLGNALGMLYNALKAGSPLLVTAGQQDTRMRLRDPLLGHDLVAMAAPVTKWSMQIERTVTYHSDWGAASALGVVLLVMTLLILWLVGRLVGFDRIVGSR